MAQLDPIFTKQFSWADGLDPAAFMSDPELGARVMASYIDNPDYQFPEVEIRDELIDGPLGSASLPIRIYGAGRTTNSPAFIWVHGGGFIAGDLDGLEADGVSREISQRGNAVVVSVGYHVANEETSYPTLHQEVSAAFDWVLANASALGIDPESITVGGASAGANLALACVLERRDDGSTLPNRLALIYPALHDVLPEGFDSADMTDVPNLLRIPAPLLAYMFQAYTGATAGDAPYAVPGTHELHGLPDTLVVAAEFDDLRPSAHAFTHSARDAGTEVEEILAEGAAHGFLAMTPDVAAGERVLSELARFVAGSD